MNRTCRFLLAAAASIAVSAGPGMGAGFQIPEQGVAAMAMGMGSIGLADDLSAVYHNPAGLVQLKGLHASVAVAAIAPKATYTRGGLALDGTTYVVGAENAKDDPIPVPAFAVSRSYGDDLTLAFAVNSPFGLSNEFDTDGVQRYMTTKIALTTAYFGPYMSWQATPQLSVGAGVQYVYAMAELSQHANYGGALLQEALQGNAALAEGLEQVVGEDISNANENRALDGVVDVTDATDYTMSFNMGILYQVNDQLQIGGTFRKGVDLDVEGDVELTLPETVTALSGGQMVSLETTGTTRISLPHVLGLGVAYRPSPELVLTSEVNWHLWSSYEDIDFDFAINDAMDDPSQHYLPDAENPRDWEDTMSFRLGAQYLVQDQHMLRCGYLYDQSPMPDRTHGPELPMNDRNGVTLGYGVRLGRYTVDLAYAHLFITDRTIRLTDTMRGRNAETDVVTNPSVLPLGDYEASANIAGIGLSCSF